MTNRLLGLALQCRGVHRERIDSQIAMWVGSAKARFKRSCLHDATEQKERQRHDKIAYMLPLDH